MSFHQCISIAFSCLCSGIVARLLNIAITAIVKCHQIGSAVNASVQRRCYAADLTGLLARHYLSPICGPRRDIVSHRGLLMRSNAILISRFTPVPCSLSNERKISGWTITI